jgi:hypothetical protein
MNSTNIKRTCLLSALALGAALSASAQAPASPDPATIDPGPGLVGTNYAELGFGYLREGGTPGDFRDYDFVSNEAAYRQGIWGIDGNFKFDYLNGSADGFIDHREEAMLGATGFLTQTWGKLFLTGDAGMAWESAGGASRKGFAYSLTGGVEFEITRRIAVTPFLEYDADPHLYNHAPAVANLPDHDLLGGVKGTYRFTRQWSGSLSATLDQYNSRDIGLRAGVSYNF